MGVMTKTEELKLRKLAEEGNEKARDLLNEGRPAWRGLKLLASCGDPESVRKLKQQQDNNRAYVQSRRGKPVENVGVSIGGCPVGQRDSSTTEKQDSPSHPAEATAATKNSEPDQPNGEVPIMFHPVNASWGRSKETTGKDAIPNGGKRKIATSSLSPSGPDTVVIEEDEDEGEKPQVKRRRPLPWLGSDITTAVKAKANDVCRASRKGWPT